MYKAQSCTTSWIWSHCSPVHASRQKSSKQLCTYVRVHTFTNNTRTLLDTERGEACLRMYFEATFMHNYRSLFAESWCNSKLLANNHYHPRLVYVFAMTSIGQASIYGDFLAIIARDSQQEEEGTDSEVRSEQERDRPWDQDTIMFDFMFDHVVSHAWGLPLTMSVNIITECSATAINTIGLGQNWNYKINKGTTQLYYYQDCIILKQWNSVYYYR